MKNNEKTANIRKKAIKRLIENYEIDDQQDLVKLLKKEYNLDSSQAAVSRDLRALGVGKRKIDDRMIYELTNFDVSKEILQLAVRGVAHNEAMIVVYTLPGLAAFVGDYLDMRDDLEILATIAGENVVFVAPMSIKNINQIVKKINQVLYLKQKNKELDE